MTFALFALKMFSGPLSGQKFDPDFDFRCVVTPFAK